MQRRIDAHVDEFFRAINGTNRMLLREAFKEWLQKERMFITQEKDK